MGTERKTKRVRIRKGLVASTDKRVTLGERERREKEVYSEMSKLSKGERSFIKMRVEYAIGKIVEENRAIALG
jgi:hypothetical protein